MLNSSPDVRVIDNLLVCFLSKNAPKGFGNNGKHVFYKKRKFVVVDPRFTMSCYVL